MNRKILGILIVLLVACLPVMVFATAKVDPIDTSTPSGTENPRLGDDRIRELKRGTIELFSIDHYIGTPTGNTYDEEDAGKHRLITLRETQSAKPTLGASDVGILYIKGATPELFFEDGAGNEIQLTAVGKLRFAALNNLANATYLKALDPAGTGTVDLIKAARNEANDTDVVVLPDKTRLATNAAPTEATQLANKKYVDDQIDATVGTGTFLPLAYTGQESITFPNGLIFKCGYVADAGNTTTVTFATGTGITNFTAVISCSITHKSDTSQGLNGVVSAFTTTGITIIDSHTIAGYYWQAWGR